MREKGRVRESEGESGREKGKVGLCVCACVSQGVSKRESTYGSRRSRQRRLSSRAHSTTEHERARVSSASCVCRLPRVRAPACVSIGQVNTNKYTRARARREGKDAQMYGHYQHTRSRTRPTTWSLPPPGGSEGTKRRASEKTTNDGCNMRTLPARTRPTTRHACMRL